MWLKTKDSFVLLFALLFSKIFSFKEKFFENNNAKSKNLSYLYSFKKHLNLKS